MNPKTLFFLLAFLSGLAVDFLFNGVFKIVWFLVYAPSYLAIVKLLESRFENTRWASFTPRAGVIFFVGAAVGHLALTGYRSEVTVRMNLTTDSPMTFTSPSWPQYLIVVSDKVQARLAAAGAGKTDVPITIDKVTNYGCIAAYNVRAVAGVDVMNDKNATWTWKTDAHSTAPEDAGPGTEDRRFPWCAIRFYRT